MAKNRPARRAPQGQPGATPGPALVIQKAPAVPQPPADEKVRLTTLIRTLEKHRAGRVIVYWLTDAAKMSEGVIPSLFDQLSVIGKQPSIDLVLFTRGGDTEIPSRIVSLVREFTDRFSVLIPYRAYSSGTLLAMGSDEIVMTPLSVLGPIDPSRTHPLLPRREGAKEAEPISVQDMRHAMEFIRQAAGKDERVVYTPEAMAQIFSALFEKIHPLAIGAIEQSYALAKLVGKQCLSTHMDPATEGAKIDEIVDKLCDEYKSHAYQISRREALAIGLKVVDASPSVEAALMDLLKFYTARPVMPPTVPPKGQVMIGHIGWLDSTGLFLRAEAQFEIVDAGKGELRNDSWKPY